MEVTHGRVGQSHFQVVPRYKGFLILRYTCNTYTMQELLIGCCLPQKYLKITINLNNWFCKIDTAKYRLSIAKWPKDDQDQLSMMLTDWLKIKFHNTMFLLSRILAIKIHSNIFQNLVPAKTTSHYFLSTIWAASYDLWAALTENIS